MVEITYQMVLSTLQTAGLLVGIFYYIMTLRNQRKNQDLQLETRQTQLFMQLFQHHISKERFQDSMKLSQMEWDDFDDFARKYDSAVNVENFAMRYNQWYFWEGMGLLLNKGLIDGDMIYHLLGSGFGILTDWDQFGSIIKEMRVRLDQPNMNFWFEYLVEEMKKIREEKTGQPWKPLESTSFIREET